MVPLYRGCTLSRFGIGNSSPAIKGGVMFLNCIKISNMKILVTLFCVLFISGCGTPLSQNDAKLIHKIAVIPAGDPVLAIDSINNMTVFNQYSGGVIGYILAHGGDVDNVTRLNEQMKDRNLHIGSELTDKIESNLKSKGYEVIRLSVINEGRGKFIDSYDKLDTSADAIIEISIIAAGYYDRALAPYYPTLMIKVRLVEGRTHRLLFEGQFSYVGMTSLNGEKVIEVNDKYHVWHGDDIQKDPDKSVDGFRIGIAGLADLVAKQLAK